MKCDRALDKLTTGGPFERWRAARHVAYCPDCSAKAESLLQIIDALSEVPPLTDLDRRSWMKVAKSDASAPLWLRIRFDRVLALAAMLLVMPSIIYSYHWAMIRLKKPPRAVAVAPSPVKQATLRDLDRIQDGASTLSKELDDLLREVDLLDARRDVEALEVQLAGLGGRRDP